jgi:RNA polymerase sigma-19 factor, ECF subfamily
MVQQDFNLQSDEQLVKAIGNSDHEAFKKLYYKYFPLLIRFAWYRLHSIDISRDLIQEVFTRIWNKRHNLNPDKSIKAYLYKSLNNLIINFQKLSSSKNKSIEDLRGEQNLKEQIDLDMKIDVQAAVQNLPEKIKTVFILSRIEGYKYNEIAGICNISVKAVEKRMSKAFNLLREIFNK